MRKLLSEGWITLKLAIPMILGKAGTTLMHAIDALMIAKVGVIALAACAFGGAFVGFWLLAGIGVCAAVHVRISQNSGEDKLAIQLQYLKHGFWLALIFGLFWSIAVPLGLPLIHYIGQPPEITTKAEPYILLLTWSVIPVLIYESLKSYYEATNRAWLPMAITLIGIVINVVLNWILIFGNLGFPKMGLEGAGLATLLSRCFMACTLSIRFLISISKQVTLSLKGFFKLEFDKFKGMLQIAFPSAIQLFAEMGFYNVVVFIAGWIGATALAAHQILITYVLLVLIIPYTFSMASTIRIGQACDKEDKNHIRLVGMSSLLFSILFASFMALFCYLMRNPIINLFVETGSTYTLVYNTFFIVAIYQIAQATYLNANGILRGMGDVKIPTYILLGSLWCVSLPLGTCLAHYFDQGLQGLWFGIFIGTALSAITLVIRFRLGTKPKMA